MSTARRRKPDLFAELNEGFEALSAARAGKHTSRAAHPAGTALSRYCAAAGKDIGLGHCRQRFNRLS